MNKNVSTFITIYQRFEGCKEFDDLWECLIDFLKEYDISSVAYGCSYSPDVLLKAEKPPKPFQRVQHKNGTYSGEYINQYGFIRTTHPPSYQDYFNTEFGVVEDAYAMHCILRKEPLKWHEFANDLTLFSDRQKQQVKDFEKIGMGVGISIPIRFGEAGIAGVGLCYQGSKEMFDRMWEDSQEDIMRIVMTFDGFTRMKDKLSFYDLSQRKREVLQTLVLEGEAQLVARKLGVEVTTIYDHLSQIQKILHVNNDIQAIVKAARFNLIQM